MQYGILLHEPSDDVGVAVHDLTVGAEVGAVTLEGQAVGSVLVRADIPLGHKVAMHEVPQGNPVIEYGRPIGKAVQAIECGDHVHSHNLRTARWSI